MRNTNLLPPSKLEPSMNAREASVRDSYQAFRRGYDIKSGDDEERVAKAYLSQVGEKLSTSATIFTTTAVRRWIQYETPYHKASRNLQRPALRYQSCLAGQVESALCHRSDQVATLCHLAYGLGITSSNIAALKGDDFLEVNSLSPKDEKRVAFQAKWLKITQHLNRHLVLHLHEYPVLLPEDLSDAINDLGWSGQQPIFGKLSRSRAYRFSQETMTAAGYKAGDLTRSAIRDFTAMGIPVALIGNVFRMTPRTIANIAAHVPPPEEPPINHYTAVYLAIAAYEGRRWRRPGMTWNQSLVEPLDPAQHSFSHRKHKYLP